MIAPWLDIPVAHFGRTEYTNGRGAIHTYFGVTVYASSRFHR
jgi:hypothetical protein